MTLIINILMTIIILFIVPFLVGNAVCGLLKKEFLLAESYVTGHITIWAILQLIAVPLVFAKQSFSVCFYVSLITIAFVLVLGFLKKSFVKPDFSNIEKNDRLIFILCGVLLLCLVVATVVLSHLDEDDSRFVVNSVDMLNTNKMFLTNPATGASLSNWEGELAKDVTSPWAVYIAFVAKLTGVKAVVAAHFTIPIALIVLFVAALWMISPELVGESKKGRTLFIYTATFLALFSGYSARSAYDYFMIRSWQGKAVVAGVGIMLLFCYAMRLFKDESKAYIGLVITELAMCLMSGMGIIISAIAIGCFAIVYGIEKKSLVKMLKVGVLAAPAMIYFVINQMQ